MVGGVFMQVRETEYEFEHAVTLIGIGFIGAGFELLHGSKRVREEPFEFVRLQRMATLAILESAFGAHGSFVEEMVEAQLCRSER
jgi:hypothetical protein